MYVTAEEIRARYGTKVDAWLSDISQESGSSNAVTLACEDASQEIDGYLTLARVKLPLDPVPGYIKGYAADIAAYLLMMRAGKLSVSESGEDEIISRAKSARTFFEKWAEGGFDGGAKDGSPSPVRDRVRVNAPKKMDLRGY